MAVPVIMPRQGQSVETCIITQWTKKKGDTVKAGDILFSYETDKASFDVEAQADGILLETFYNEGDEVPVLINVAAIGLAGESVENLRPDSQATAAFAQSDTIHVIAEEKSKSQPVTMDNQPEDKRLRISPRARMMAVRMGVNPVSLKGSGPNGRILVRDIETAPPAAAPVYPLSTEVEFEEKKLSNIRKLIARTMHESISLSAQLTHHMSADVRKLLALRNRVKADMEKGSTLNITLNDMICFAVIRALGKFPELNSHFLGESTRTFKKVHLGLAVDTPRGLMVPAIRNTDDLSLKGLSVRLHEIADQCKKGNVNPDLLASAAASFTVSNLGNYGVEIFTPIINLPQVAILGINTIINRPANLGNGVFGFIPVIGLSLTYDHRAVDGGPASLFLREIRNQIENFEETV
jgi:pyruvate dehydrogenase E2 component (dihydrolipoamide acetyltransferase)